MDSDIIIPDVTKEVAINQLEDEFSFLQLNILPDSYSCKINLEITLDNKTVLKLNEINPKKSPKYH